jgi:signal transduction histidine kinase
MFLKGILSTFLFVIGAALLILVLNAINSGLSFYLTASGNEIDADEAGGRLYTVENIQSQNHEATLAITSDALRPVSVLIDNLEFAHEITVNGEPVTQNTDAAAANYDSGYAYKVIEIGESQYIDGKAVIRITGADASGVEIYLADSNLMEAGTETRTICYTVLLTCLFLIFLFCIVHYFFGRGTRWHLLFAANAAVSIIKSINLGELFVLAGVLGFIAENYAVIDSITGNINSILLVFIMLNIMQIPVNKWWKASMAVFLILLTVLALPAAPKAVCILLQIIRVGVCSALSIYGYVQKKPFGVMLFILNMMFLSFVFYGAAAVNLWHRAGALDFTLFFPYLGNVICLSAVLLAFMKSQLRKTRALEAQKKEFERIALLRGIGHDLKLPLSVIKTSNQMRLKYDLNEDKRNEYAQMSLEAASELEKMTDNISGFLSLNHLDGAAISASLRESFDKAQRHYAAYAAATGYRFFAGWEGPDATLPAAPIHVECVTLMSKVEK